MISVIIPLMPVEPYSETCKATIDALKEQTIECEVIVSRQDIEPYIKKGKLLNKGIEQASGDIIWFCDADFIPEPTLLERVERKVAKDNIDVLYPMFYSKKYRQLKIADGGPFIKREVLEDYGKIDELDGISWVTFPFLRFSIDYRKLYCTNEFIIDINETPQRIAGKRHWKTSGKLRSLYKETVEDLQEMGVWP